MTKYTLTTGRRLGEGKVPYEQELNPQQLEVVMAPGGPMLVIAGAGSGKTRTLTYRTARLLESGAPPERMLLVTFTIKAAREMLHRVELLISKEAQRIWGGTFHHIGNRILRRHADKLGYQTQYSILDREDAKTLVNSCIAELGIDTRAKRFPKGDVLQELFSFTCNTQAPLPTLIEARYPMFVELTDAILKVRDHYRKRKRALNAMDYDDLLINWLELFHKHPEVRQRYAEQFQHILVDEYQDTNLLQGALVDALAERHHNVMVVGDDAQSIYSFRGAHFANIMEFPKRYPEAKIYKLETNYRSTPEILELANESIQHNERQFEKRLAAVKPSKPKPVVVPLADSTQQAAFVAQRVLELRDEGVELHEMAVLYRSHYHSMELQLELARRGIPFEVRSGLRFFEQAHVKDVLSYLRVLVNPYDELSWKRILKLLPRIGETTAQRIWERLKGSADPLADSASDAPFEGLPPQVRLAVKPLQRLMQRLTGQAVRPSEIIRTVLRSGYQDQLAGRFTDYRDRAEDLEQLERFATQYGTAEEFLSELALQGSVESEVTVAGPDSDDEEQLVLSTIHQAKGLEWDVVFVIWLVDGRFPSGRTFHDEEAVEEERRLFYVAATRARSELHLCYPLMSFHEFDSSTILRPSRFINELPHHVYETWEIETEVT